MSMSFEVPLPETFRKQLAVTKSEINVIKSPAYKKAVDRAINLVVDAVK